ncbi:MAG: hypothetical protein GY777_09950 [Candidatus Brocadiaceae bacterium]|nr:hypothetical protein [Candidatus Brocadiaceae bacterium]
MDDVESYLNFLQIRIKSISEGQSTAWVQPKVIYEDPLHPHDGDIRSMTAFTNKVKVVKIISTNPVRQKHWSVSVGATLLLDYEENHPLAIFDATMMSSIRTSAMAILGAIFSGCSLDNSLIIGFGRVGQYASEMILKLNSNHSIQVYDKVLPDNLPSRCRRYNSTDTFSADTIITATTSRTPFLTEDNTTANFIASVGADTAFNFELTTDLIQSRGGLYVDCIDAMHVGDLSRSDNVEDLITGDLFDLCLNGNKKAKTLVSVGSPLMDALTIEYMAEILELI